MTDKDRSLMEGSCRVALSAFLHDMGKFAERAGLATTNSRLESHLHQYCPFHRDGGWFSHRHAAYTALVWDWVEKMFPELVGDDVFPFAAWNAPDVDDSVVNAAARHHKPETFLQWIVATADRVASGFERERFEQYNLAQERTSTGRNHYTARQITLFEQIRIEGKVPGEEHEFRWRYPLKPLSVASLFPVKAEGYEHDDKEKAKQEYRELWDGFMSALQKIPESHRGNWPLWLDHLDTLWGTFTHAIPSATAFGVRPEVSLYDHSRTTAALATALWRYHHDLRHDPQEAVAGMRDRTDWVNNKLLLILGDFFGIQDFIFTSGAETQRNSARLLRGRSFHVSLLTECAALKVLEALELPPTSQVINAAGKFLIVAPNTDVVRHRILEIQKDVDRWFLKYTWGQSGLGIVWEPAACNDFLQKGKEHDPPFRQLINRLFARMEDLKAQRLSLCSEGAPAPLFEGFLELFDRDKGVCVVDGCSPATEQMEKSDEKYVCALAADQIRIGKWLGRSSRVLVTCADPRHHTLSLDLFGYYISFTGAEEHTGRFGRLARDGQLRRAWDFSQPPGGEDEPLFSGYARREINAYVPRFGDRNALESSRYEGIDADAEWEPGAPKTFAHIARDDLWLDENDRWSGTDALMVLKGDVDNLGSIFEKGLERPSFAKWASLSRQVNAFFAIYLPWLCRERYSSTYTVFAGGDDFFLVGPWRSTIRLARAMREAFGHYVAGNPEIHFSSGLVMVGPGIPARQLGDLSEAALDEAKDREGKDAVSIFGESVSWREFDVLWHTFEEMDRIGEAYGLSTGYLYRLQELALMSENLKSKAARPENAIWRSWFSYRTWRMLERAKGIDDNERRRRMVELAKVLSSPIEQFGSRFQIPLFIHLYQQRH